MKPKEITTALWLFAIHGAWAFTLALYDENYPGGISIISLAFFYGIWRGSALAWNWSKFVLYASALTHILLLVGAIVATFADQNWEIQRRIICYTANASVGYYALWSLNRTPSLAYFGLVCPICSRYPARANSFLFRRKACRHCGHQW